MTAAKLKACTSKELAQMAKKRGVPGWHSMRKEQLLRVLLKNTSKPNKPTSAPNTASRRVHSANGSASHVNGSVARTNGTAPRTSVPAPRTNGSASHAANGNGHKSNGAANGHAKPAAAAVPKPPARRTTPNALKKIAQMQNRLGLAKNIATPADKPDAEIRDRLVVMVRDPYWLHAYWELNRRSVSRVEAAMGQHWHTAKPMLRLFEVSDVEGGSAADTLLRSIEIHGGVNNWYIDVDQPSRSYRLDIGYQASDGTFYPIVRSNVVATPASASCDGLDGNWTDVAENFDRIYALSGGYSTEGSSRELQEVLEERLQRPMGSPIASRYGAGAEALLGTRNEFHFEAEAEMVLFGSTRPGAHITMLGEPMRLRPDGTFMIRLPMPDRRQVIPLVACSADGLEQRTIVIAVERNTKRMESQTRDAMV